jgi:hypothetical protein
MMDFFEFTSLQLTSCEFCAVMCWVILKFRPRVRQPGSILVHVGAGRFLVDLHHGSLVLEPDGFDLYRDEGVFKRAC